MVKLEIKYLKKEFDQVEVLKGISLTVKSGDIICLIGSSGSGKSTLLRCINMLEYADSGTIKLNDTEILFTNGKSSIRASEENRIRIKIGMVFQQFNLWSHLTVLQNLIKAPIYVLKRPKNEAIFEAKQLLATFELSDKINNYPSQLSGGQQQRIAIARALMMHPEIILFDEPTSALDPLMTQEVLTIIKKLKDNGITMIVATHTIEFAQEIASYVLFLEHGKIIEEGYAYKIFNAPQTMKLQKFLKKTYR